MRGDLAGRGWLRIHFSITIWVWIRGYKLSASSQNLAVDIFCFSCLGFLKIGISNNDLRIEILHTNIWLAGFCEKQTKKKKYLATRGSYPNSSNRPGGRTGASNLPQALMLLNVLHPVYSTDLYHLSDTVGIWVSAFVCNIQQLLSRQLAL